MNLKKKLNHAVTLVKSTGKTFEDIKALVTADSVIISDISIPVEAGNKLTQELPNGTTRTMKVSKVVCEAKKGTRPAAYVIEVE